MLVHVCALQACGPVRQSVLAREIVQHLWSAMDAAAPGAQPCNNTHLFQRYNWRHQHNPSAIDKCDVVGVYCGWRWQLPSDQVFQRLHEQRRHSGSLECPPKLTFDQLGKKWNHVNLDFPAQSVG